jgi:hypothetical protein
MNSNKKIVLIISAMLIIGVVYYFFKNKSLRKRYNIIKDRDFEIMVEKNK